ncbi:MAG: L,D-transpeptidase family protein [Verrucomicrobia bacterium]|nr:L,D-transpeptidase family protein [Verrucomicrobiota bacterium]
MADIYVRPYDRGVRKSPKGLLVFALGALLLGALGWWAMAHRSQQNEPGEVIVTVESVGQPAPATPAAAPKPAQTNLQNLFTRAQSMMNSGKLLDASRLLDQVISTSTDENLQNNALRMQGRINVELFLSEAASPWKKSYVIQPGDSLDRIARRNSTTVDLIRRINGIEGNLIYPGARLLLPAAPFVVEVDKSSRTMELVMDGKRFKRYSVGLGRFGKTPLGNFMTVVHQANPDWSPPSGGIVPYGDPRNVLGTRWISIQDETRPEIRGFGIHGTADRESIGSETSNGCIRMLNEDVEEVFLLIPRGTKVFINE